MKLITLNAWGGRVKDKLEEFLTRTDGVDIWCFQEVYNSTGPLELVKVPGYPPDSYLMKTIATALNRHDGHFCPTLKEFYGMAAFTSKDIEVIEKGEILIARGDWENEDLHNRDCNRKMQWMEIRVKGQRVLVMNAHLTHRPEGKQDSEKRFKQSIMITHFMSMYDCPKVLAGDFNLLPDTESIAMIERAGLRNLVKEYGVTSTRTSLYQKPLKFADYIFVSPEIKVKDFKVLPDVVSDHHPLYIEFDI